MQPNKLMQAIQIQQFGGPEVMQIEKIPQPQPGPGEMKVQVMAAGVNPLDAKTRDGSNFVAEKLGENLPIGLGIDLSGIITEIGSEVTGWKVGDQVAGTVTNFLNPSSYAEYALASPTSIARKPEEISFITAAALPIAGCTAWQAVHEFGKITAGQRVLIHAGAGAVGHLAIQLAKQQGAFIATTAQEENFAWLKQYGADQCIDYTQSDFTKIVSDIDVVIDLVGGKTGLDSIQVLKPGGRLVTIPTYSQAEVMQAATNKNIDAIGFVVDISKSMRAVLDSVKQGKLHIKIAKTFPLTQARQAHEALAARKRPGKIVLDVGQDK